MTKNFLYFFKKMYKNHLHDIKNCANIIIDYRDVDSTIINIKNKFKRNLKTI